MIKLKKIEKNVDREKLVHKTDEYTYSFENLQTIKTFGKDIYNGTITLKEANDYQTDLLAKIMDFKKNIKTKKSRNKTRKNIVLENLYIFFMVEKKFLMLLKVKYFQ